MPSFALFGDSYVTRLGKFCDFNLKVPGNAWFFAKGGMKSCHYDEWLQNDRFDEKGVWTRILRDLEYQPDVCFMCLGGIDIHEDSDPSDIVGNFLRLTDKLKDVGVKRINVADISKRGCFKKSPGLSKETFEVKRNAVNKKLKKSSRTTL